MSFEKRLEALEGRLGYAFQDRTRLKEALTHASFGDGRRSVIDQDNERLEFLGDRVLGLLAAEYLKTHVPDAEVGEWARRHVALVRKETCAQAARNWGLQEILRTTRGMSRKDIAASDAILGDAAEAVIAALYLDGGLRAARRAFLSGWHLDGASARVGPAVPDGEKHPKSTLAEWAQAHGLGEPVYRTLGRRGPDHAPEFEVEVDVKGLRPVRAHGSSKAEASTAAALQALAVWESELPESERRRRT